jgi:hypothetical protein
MRKGFAESAVLIGLMPVSIKSNSHRYPQRPFASTASTPFDHQGNIIGPPAVDRIPTYMYKSFVESAVLIRLTLLSIE